MNDVYDIHQIPEDLRRFFVRAELGLEPTPEEYVSRLVAVFSEVRRVLSDDGTLWLNLGDCYATGAGKVGDCPGGGQQGARWIGDASRVRDSWRRDRAAVVPSRALRDGTHAGKHTAIAAMGPMSQPNRMPLPGLKPKDLVGIPWRVAFALQADGWWLRADIIWAKPNTMPESVRDRPTKAHEYLFLLAKSEHYYYDAAAIRTPQKDVSILRRERGRDAGYSPPGQTAHRGESMVKKDKQRGHSRRHAWFNDRWDSMSREDQMALGSNARSVWTIATRPFTEAHFATFPPALVEPCILAGSRPGDTVLDPFCGAGTTLLVAQRLGRNAVGIDLNQDYLDMTDRRLRGETPGFVMECS